VEVVPVQRAVGRPPLASPVSRRALFLPLILLAALVSLLYLSQTSDVATTGYDIADLQSQKATLEMENEQLRLQIAQLESLDRVDQAATTRLHMGPPRQAVYVTASTVSIPTPSPTAMPVEETTRSLVGAIWHSISSTATLRAGGSP